MAIRELLIKWEGHWLHSEGPLVLRLQGRRRMSLPRVGLWLKAKAEPRVRCHLADFLSGFAEW